MHWRIRVGGLTLACTFWRWALRACTRAGRTPLCPSTPPETAQSSRCARTHRQAGLVASAWPGTALVSSSVPPSCLRPRQAGGGVCTRARGPPRHLPSPCRTWNRAEKVRTDWCTVIMCSTISGRRSSGSASSARNTDATLCSACSGHGSNQSITVLFTCARAREAGDRSPCC